VLSIVFVILYSVVHTRRLFLSIVGLLLSLSAVPLAYVTCAWGGMSTVSFASFIAVFLIVGFGCDTVLIYFDAWRDSADHWTDDADRLAWTFIHGGEASLASVCATSVSFFVNLFSAIRALRWFGFFMGLCVTFSWVLISLVFVPLCLLDERCNRRGPCATRKGDGLNAEKPSFLGGRRKLFERWTSFVHRWRYVLFLVAGHSFMYRQWSRCGQLEADLLKSWPLP
jgi:predicted RND superfamily exporter protein